MKNSVNNQSVSNNVVMMNIVNNPQGTYKYINRENLIAAYEDLVVKCRKADIKAAVPADAEKLGKRFLIDSYIELATTYLQSVGAEEEPEQVNEPEATSLVEEVAADEPVAEVKEKEPATSVNEAPKSHRGNAEERLAKYSAELAEKEAIAEPSKDIRKRIASLKRKIERATKALHA